MTTHGQRREDATRRRTSTGFALVALAAALWGSDALFRRGLALSLPATTVVIWEHLILVVLLAPVALRIPWRRLTVADVTSLVLIGAGSSALATILFTAAFRYGDVNTPLLLQKLQPVIAVILAFVVLGERPTRRFAWYLLLALAAAWLITFPEPLSVRPRAAAAGALGAASAALWAMGTVLARRMSGVLTFAELSAARFVIGLPASLLIAAVQGVPLGSLMISTDELSAVLVLALVPGLIAMLLYYRGMRRTPASVATIAELAFPLTALSLSALVFGQLLRVTQAIGVVLLSGVLVALAAMPQTRRLIRSPQASDVEAPPLMSSV